MIGDLAQVAMGAAAAGYAAHRSNAHKIAVTPFLDVLATALIGAAGVMVMLGVLIARQPVVVQSRIEVLSHTPGQVRFRMYGVKPKAKKKCEYLPPAEAYVVTPDGVAEADRIVFERDATPGNTRPPGFIDFGVVRVEYSTIRPATAVRLRARHSCALWMPDTITDQGPFKVPAPQ
jgi:hypothetical protein